MSTELHWIQYRELDALQDRLGDLAKRARPVSEGQQESTRVADWVPLVDISEDPDEYVIKAELSEVNKEDVTITLKDGKVTMMGHRKFEKEENGKKYHHIERAYGSFVRTILLPNGADPSNFTADFKDGVLKVRLAKSTAPAK